MVNKNRRTWLKNRKNRRNFGVKIGEKDVKIDEKSAWFLQGIGVKLLSLRGRTFFFLFLIKKKEDKKEKKEKKYIRKERD